MDSRGNMKTKTSSEISKVVLKYMCSHPIPKLTAHYLHSNKMPQNNNTQGKKEENSNGNNSKPHNPVTPSECPECAAQATFPGLAEVSALVNSNQPHELNAHYHLLMKKAQNWSKTKGISMEQFEVIFNQQQRQAPAAATSTGTVAFTGQRAPSTRQIAKPEPATVEKNLSNVRVGFLTILTSHKFSK